MWLQPGLFSEQGSSLCAQVLQTGFFGAELLLCPCSGVPQAPAAPLLPTGTGGRQLLLGAVCLPGRVFFLSFDEA